MVRRWMCTSMWCWICLALLSSCSKNEPPTVAQTAASDPDPHWVIQQTPPAKVALVYVHGVTGDMIGTWTADNGQKFWDLANENPTLRGKADAFVYGFPSYLFKSGSFDIQQAANRLHERLEYHQVLNYPAVVFVAHSMGGLVVLRELLTHREVLEKVPVVMFYATPMEGSIVAAIGKQFSPNSALAQMTEADGNALLQNLDNEWKSIPDDKRPHVRCAYENKPIGPLKIVPWSSATRFCNGATPAVEATHITIVKPDRPGADAIIYLANALNEYVLGKQLEAKLETPDFTTEGTESVFLLKDVLGKQSARLVNTGGSPLTFTLAEISDPALLLWPDDTPLAIDKFSTKNMSVALSRAATASEYRFVLRTSVGSDRHVVVRVPDRKSLDALQAAIAHNVGEQIKAALSEPGQLKQFQSAAVDDKRVPIAIVQIARAEIERQNPKLPESAQWILSADLLSSLNWPTLAAQALRMAEQASPAAVRQPGVQFLGGLVAAQSGEKQIFASTATPILSSEALSAWKAQQPLTTPGSSGLGLDVARRMRDVPALKVFGLSLEGDVEKANGNTESARRLFKEAAAIRPSPSVTARIQTLDFTSGIPPAGIVPQREQASHQQPAAPVPSASHFRVGLNTYGVTAQEWQRLENRLGSLGYQQHRYSYPYSRREPWMAQQPTVIYYRRSSIPAAERLANQMTLLTGEPFIIRQGNGFGVEPGEESTTLFVHLVRN